MNSGMEQWSLSANKDIISIASSSSDTPQLLYQSLYKLNPSSVNSIQPWKVIVLPRFCLQCKGPLIGVGLVLAAAGAIFLYLWKHKTAEQLQEEYETLREENMRLRIQSRHLLAYTKDLKKKNSQLTEENAKVSERIQRLEERVCDSI